MTSSLRIIGNTVSSYVLSKIVTVTPWAEKRGEGVRVGTVTRSENGQHWSVRVRIVGHRGRGRGGTSLLTEGVP